MNNTPQQTKLPPTPNGTNPNDRPTTRPYSSRGHPYTYPGNYYYHYYPPPPPPYPYHTTPSPAYIGPPSSRKYTPNTSTFGPKALYPPPHPPQHRRQHQYDTDAFTPHPPKSSRPPPFASPPRKNITPHYDSWIPEGVTSPEKTYRYDDDEEYETPVTLTNSASSESTTESHHTRPTPAKSAFMYFLEAKKKHKQEEETTDSTPPTTNQAAEAWKHISHKERQHWESIAERDRKRYKQERRDCHPSLRKVRRKKDPTAPKRPMSAFLMYAQTKRRELQRANPDIPNADISRLLGECWRNATPEVKAPFIEREEVERIDYRAKMERWKCDQKLAKSLSPKAYSTPVLSVVDQRQDEEEVLAARLRNDDGTTPSGRYASPPNIHEFGAAYPVEGSYLYGGYQFGGESRKESVLTPTTSTTVQAKRSPYWESPYQEVDESVVKYSYPRPDDEETK